MKFLTHTVLNMSSLQCSDGFTYSEHVVEVSYMKQTLDGVMFNIDEIFLTLQLFYFQDQEDLVYKLRNTPPLTSRLLRLTVPVLVLLILILGVREGNLHS